MNTQPKTPNPPPRPIADIVRLLAQVALKRYAKKETQG